MPEEDSVLLRETEGIQEMILNRPSVLNALNSSMIRRLFDALEAAEKNPTVHCVVVAGNGKGFCAGQDLKEFTEALSPHAVEEHVARYYNPLITRLYYCPKPTIASIQGVAAGAGMSLALACDFRVASTEAKFIQAFVNIGLVPDSGSTYFLPRMIGSAKAMEWTLLGDTVDAQQAWQLGLITSLTAPADLGQVTRRLAARLVEAPSSTMALIKKAIRQSGDNSWEQQLTLEQQLQQVAAGTTDHRRRLDAFVHKGKL